MQSSDNVSDCSLSLSTTFKILALRQRMVFFVLLVLDSLPELLLLLDFIQLFDMYVYLSIIIFSSYNYNVYF